MENVSDELLQQSSCFWGGWFSALCEYAVWGALGAVAGLLIAYGWEKLQGGALEDFEKSCCGGGGERCDEEQDESASECSASDEAPLKSLKRRKLSKRKRNSVKMLASTKD